MNRQLKQTTNEVSDEPLTMTIKDVAKALQCSNRHITNLRKQNRIPQPARLGKRKGIRWPRQVIEDWIAAGCPALAV
jgi:predicted DNA-binding transcriptional regulator AlpA